MAKASTDKDGSQQMTSRDMAPADDKPTGDTPTDDKTTEMTSRRSRKTTDKPPRWQREGFASEAEFEERFEERWRQANKINALNLEATIPWPKDVGRVSTSFNKQQAFLHSKEGRVFRVDTW